MSRVGGSSGGGGGNRASESNRNESRAESRSNRDSSTNASSESKSSSKTSESKADSAKSDSKASTETKAKETTVAEATLSKPDEATRAAARRQANLDEASMRAHVEAQMDADKRAQATADVEAMVAAEGWQNDVKAAEALKSDIDTRLADFSPEVRGQIGQKALEGPLHGVLATEDPAGFVDTKQLEVAGTFGSYMTQDHLDIVSGNAHSGMDRARRSATLGTMNEAFENGLTKETRMAGAYALTMVDRTTMSRAMNGAVEGITPETFGRAAQLTQDPERMNYVLDEAASNGFHDRMTTISRTPVKLDPAGEFLAGAITPVAESAHGVVTMVQDPMGTFRAVRKGVQTFAGAPVETTKNAAIDYKNRVAATWAESPPRAVGSVFTEGLAALTGVGGAVKAGTGAVSKLSRPDLPDRPLRANFEDIAMHPDVSVVDGLAKVDEGSLRNALTDPEAAKNLAQSLGSSPRRVQRDAAILLSRAEAGPMKAGEVVPRDQLAFEAGLLGHQIEPLDAVYRLDGRTPQEVLAAGGFKPNPTRDPATLWEHTAKGVGGGGSYVSTSTVPGNRSTLLNSDFWDGKIVSGTRPADFDPISPTPLNPEPLTYSRYEYRIRDAEGVVMRNADYPDEMEAVLRNADPSQIDVREVQVRQRWQETIDADPQFGTDYVYQLTPMRDIADEDIFRSEWSPLMDQ